MRLARPEYLFLLWAVAALVLPYIWARSRRRRILDAYARPEAGPAPTPGAAPGRRAVKAALVLTALAALALALAGPQYGFTWEKIERKGVSLMVVLDCSKSMLAEDVPPNRLQRAKREIHDLIDRLKGDKAGLAAFAGTAFLACPLTLDYGAFELFLDALGPDYIPVGGTDLAGAIRTAVDAFDPDDPAEKAVILITDGESTTADPLAAAEEAAGAGVTVFTIGVGGPEGAPIPEAGGGFKKDTRGNIVMSRLNETELKEIAAKTGGTYARSVTGDLDLEAIYDQEILGQMRREELEGGRKKVWHDRYRWPLALAAAALFLDLLVTTRTAAAAILVLALIAPPGPALAAGYKALVRQGVEAYQAEEYQKAVERLRQAQVRRPEHPAALYDLGAAHYKLEQYHRAEKHYQAALDALAPDEQHDPVRAKTLYNLGNAQFRQGELDEAIQSYEKSLDINPEDEQTRQNLEFVKKMKEQQQQQQNQRRRDNQSEQDQKNQPDQSDQSRSQDQEKQQQERQPSQDEDRPESEPEEDRSSQSQQPESGPSQDQDRPQRPRYQDRADEDQLPPKPEDQQSSAAQSRPRPEEKAQPRNAVPTEQRLNRLKDKPGAAMLPQTGPRHVDKDW